MNDSEIYRIDGEDDPERCQAVNAVGQCINKAMPGCTNCKAHGGAGQTNNLEKTGLRNYRLLKFQARMGEFATSPDIKSLRDEIAILRMLLEETINKCRDSKDLILKSSVISDLIMKVDKTVTSCHKMEGSMGKLLDKSAILQFASEVINIISENVVEEDVMAKISDDILKVVGRIGERE